MDTLHPPPGRNRSRDPCGPLLFTMVMRLWLTGEKRPEHDGLAVVLIPLKCLQPVCGVLEPRRRSRNIPVPSVRDNGPREITLPARARRHGGEGPPPPPRKPHNSSMGKGEPTGQPG